MATYYLMMTSQEPKTFLKGWIKMKRTITISRGNQYNSNGYSMTDGILWSYGKATNNAKGFTQNGNCFVGFDYASYETEVDNAINCTITDGLTRIIEMTKKEKTEILMPKSKVCSKCGTYCFGDCQS